MNKFDKLASKILGENFNEKLMHKAKTEFNNWLEGSRAGEFGIDDLADICYNLVQEFGDDAYNEIEMTLQSFVDDGIIEDEEMQHVNQSLRNLDK